MKKTEIVNRVQELEALSPPVSPVEALRRNLLYAMFNGVTEDDVTTIVGQQVEKAKTGDTKASALVLKMIQAGGTERGVTHMQQAVVVNDPNKHERFLSDTREQIARIMAAQGPKQSADFANSLYAPLPHVLEALNDHPWFEKKKDGWDITDAARKDLKGTLERKP